LIDPYVLSSSIGRITNQEIRITKPIKVLEIQPKKILIGNSRNNYSSEITGDDSSTFYNLSLSGIGINEISKLFYHAVYSSNSNLNIAYIGLDSVCDPKDSLYISKFIDERFLISSKNQAYNIFFNKYALYTSYDTLLLSIENSTKGFLNKVGRQTIFNEGDYLVKGASHALRKKEETTIGTKVDKKSAQPILFKDYRKTCKTASLNRILNIAKKENIQLTFFLNPVNVRYWEIQFHKNGLQHYLFDKKIIKDTIYAALIGATNSINVIDFRELNEFTLERLSYEDPTDLYYKYWYESSHFTKTFGDMTSKILDSNEYNNTALSSNLLNADIEGEFKVQLNILKKWRMNNPDLVNEIQQAIYY
jgi:hypothetical protein